MFWLAQAMYASGIKQLQHWRRIECVRIGVNMENRRAIFFFAVAV